MSTVGAIDQIAFTQKSSIAPPEYGAFLGFVTRMPRARPESRRTRRVGNENRSA
jgi:hypothetical protein